MRKRTGEHCVERIKFRSSITDLCINYHKSQTCGSGGASVITNWLQYYNLREVQYMAGHKYVSSTERYRTDNLEDL